MSLVTVIIPTYNNPEELIRALHSIFRQTYNDIEIIIVNDGSNLDYGSVKRLINEHKKYVIYYFEKVNEGPGIARQFALEKANGKYIQYLDSDDEILEDKIEYQVNILKHNPDLIMTYGWSMINKDKNKLHRKKNIRIEIEDLLVSTLQIRKWHTSSSLWNYSCKKYWCHLKNGEDVLHDFSAGILNSHRKVLFSKKLVANINFDKDGYHLSDAARDLNNRGRLVADSLYLNDFLYESLKKNNLDVKLYKEPLSERLLHTAIKFIIWGNKKEAMDYLFKSQVLTMSKRKKVEILIVKILMVLPIKNKRKMYQNFYRVHRIINPPETHQFRSV